MIRIAVVEDDAAYVEIIQDYVKRFMSENSLSIKLDIYRDGRQIVFSYEPVYDIILMDVEMPGMDGIASAGKIREQDKNVIIIFITNMAQYAIEGYKVRARSYILKPVNYYSFAFELKEAVMTLEKKTEDCILIPGEDGLVKLMTGEIYFLESQKHNIVLYTKKGDMTIRETMRNMEKKLKNSCFERCNVSYLVNLAYVSAISGDMAQVGSYRIPISRQKRKPFIQALSAYIGGGTDD